MSDEYYDIISERITILGNRIKTLHEHINLSDRMRSDPTFPVWIKVSVVGLLISTAVLIFTTSTLLLHQKLPTQSISKEQCERCNLPSLQP